MSFMTRNQPGRLVQDKTYFCYSQRQVHGFRLHTFAIEHQVLDAFQTPDLHPPEWVGVSCGLTEGKRTLILPSVKAGR